jgi:O-antigen/teichoic acid export membrane protein
MGLFYIAMTKTNALTQADIGVLSILQFLSSTVMLATSLALPTALVKFASESVGKKELEEAASINKVITKTVIVLSITGCVLVALFSRQLTQYFFGSLDYLYLLMLMLIYTFLFSMVTLFSSTLQGVFLFGRMALVTILFIVASRATAVVLAIFQKSLEGVLIGYIVGSLTALVAAVAFMRGKLPRTSRSMPLRPMLTFSLPLFVSSLTLTILNWADVLLVALMTLDYSLTGIYYIAANSITALSILWIPLTTTILPAVAAKHGLGKSDDVAGIMRVSSRYLMYMILPACLGLAAISRTALDFFYGPTYVEGALSLSILSITAIAMAFNALFTTVLIALGKTAQVLKINVASAFVSIVALIIAVSPLQIIGAALARLMTQLTATALAFLALKREIKVQIDRKALLKSVLASAAFIPFLLLFDASIGERLAAMEKLPIEMVLALAIYAFFLHVLRALRSQDFNLIRQALPKVLTKYINLIERIMT